MRSPPQTQKPPEGYRNPSEALFTPPSGIYFHNSLQKDRVVLLVDLVPNLLSVQRIALFEENVHILYMSEMTQNFRLLLLTYNLGKPEKGKVTGCNVQCRNGWGDGVVG
jgi:hypothetical protein